MISTQRSVRTFLTSCLLSTLGCTVITDARDYEVDPAVAVRDLDFTFEKFPHAGQPLDVAIVNSANQMQARARIVLSPEQSGGLPSEHLVMSDTLRPGDYSLYFFVDPNENYMFDPNEHNWIEPVPASGKGEFTHSTMFAQDFAAKAPSELNADIVFELPALPVGANVDAFKACVSKKIEDIEVFEIKVFLQSESRQVGLFKTYTGNMLSKTLREDGIRIDGILDAGSEYRIEVVQDGAQILKSEIVEAPADVNVPELRVPADKWFPFRVTDCLKP
ncbi:MAG: hypothetical protein QM778_19415 [Myxococcales bacterium]